MDPPDHWPPLAARYAAAADPRARYNLACYLARLQRHAGRDKQNELTRSARSHLRHALQDADLLAWTDRDPALAPVRDADPDRWKAMLAELGAGAVNALPPGNAEAEEQSASATARSPEHSQPARFEPLADYAEAYRWRLISGHRALAVSSRSFPTEGEALRAARDIRNQVGDAQFRLAGESAAARRGWEFVFQAGPGFGQQSWDLVDAEGRSVARAPRWFGSLSAAVAAAESVQSRARDAELEDDPPANAESATTA
jgi:hypothetical protein